VPASLITLIGPGITSEHVSDLERALNAAFDQANAGLAPTEPRHASALADLEIRQWRFDARVGDVRAALDRFVSQTRSQGIEVLITPAHLADAGPRLIVTDVDSTLIRDEVIELLADHAGARDEVAAITESAMRGELDFTQSLVQRVSALAGLEASVHEEVLRALRLSAGVENLCATLKKSGDYIGVVSGGFIEIVEPLAASLGIDFARANRLKVLDGKLTGEVTGTVVDREVKAQTLRAWANECGVPLERTIAIGDGANDLSMLATAGLGVAFNAKPVVAQEADVAIVGERLDVVLAVLGS